MSFGDTSDDNSSGQESVCKRSVVDQRKCSEHTQKQPEDSRASTTKAFKCTESGCSKAYTRRWLLTTHVQQAHQNNEEEPVVKQQKKDSKNHKCPEPGCEAVFSRPFRLKNHIEAHHGGEKPFKCDFQDCTKSYTSQSHLKRHKVIAHLSEEDQIEEVICGIENCGFVCANKYSLKKHITSKHQKLPFGCHTCPEKFSRKSQLNAHKTEVHNESAPYQCKKCPKTFIHYHLYQKHKERHRTYKCDCEKSFDKWTEYLKHKKTDCVLPKTQYKCFICDKTFAWKQNLAQHCSKVHLPDSRNDDFTCPYLDCNHSYKYKKNLQFHIKHFHEKVFEYFKCTVESCETVLKSKKNLKQHLRICHSDTPLKEKVRRKPRKDKGIRKKSAASRLSGIEVSCEENKKNIVGSFAVVRETNDNANENELKTAEISSEECPRADISANKNGECVLNNEGIILFDFPEFKSSDDKCRTVDDAPVIIITDGALTV